jgi:hypothetical protein
MKATFSLENLKGESMTDDRTVLKWSLKIGHDDVYCIHLPQEKDQLKDLVNTVMNFQVP